MAALSGIQTGSATLLAANTSVSVTITAVTLANSILKYSYKGEGDRVSRNLVRGTLTSTTNITFDRLAGSSATDFTIQWEVISFSSGVSVQRGTISSPGGTQNVTITAVTIAQSFVLTNYLGGYYYDPTGHERVTAELTTTTNLQTINSYADAGSMILSWQVVDYTSASVQLVKKTHVDTALQEDVTITSTTMDRTAVFPTLRSNAGNFAKSNAEKVWLAFLESTTNLRFVRGNNNGGAGDGLTRISHVFVVKFPDVRVSRYTKDIDAGSTSTTKTITALASTSRSTVNVTSPVNYVWPWCTYSIIPHQEIFINMIITNTTTITLSRQGSGHEVTVYWEMLEWDYSDTSLKGFFMFFEPF